MNDALLLDTIRESLEPRQRRPFSWPHWTSRDGAVRIDT